MKTTGTGLMGSFSINRLMRYKRWPWHLLFWVGYIVFRSWVYYITVKHYPPVFLEYMLFSELIFVAVTYTTLWLYKRLFEKAKYLVYFIAGTALWMVYLYGRTVFQFHYLRNAPGFRGSDFFDVFINNVTVVAVYFLFITGCKYFKDGYIRQQAEAEIKQQQLMAEVNNLKSQIAPHFLFNTLNNLYGLAVDKSDKLPGLMLRLSDLLRHSLYETQKPLIPLNDELNTLKSYIELETIRLENDLELEFDNTIPAGTQFQIAPLILIVFIENAFKHAKLVQSAAVYIYIKTSVENDWFMLTVKNNYNHEQQSPGNGIGLINVKRRLEVLYPDQQHQLMISRDEKVYTVTLHLQLERAKI